MSTRNIEAQHPTDLSRLLVNECGIDFCEMADNSAVLFEVLG